jgi:hypothetical protein
MNPTNRLDQTLSLAKVLVNIYNNEMLLDALLNEIGEHRISQYARQKVGFITKTTKSQKREIESCFSTEYLAIVKKELTDENLVLQTDGAVDMFLKLPVKFRDFVENTLEDLQLENETTTARLALFEASKTLPLASINNLLINAKSSIR